ncbi:hypothetical protein F4779DRAFT_486432 [Xylariaceae sp. FL0662B]|nr:hypothetical protein F4779DRAFT_486432 [Xylariaceae sp. FL0662B]
MNQIQPLLLLTYTTLLVYARRAGRKGREECPRRSLDTYCIQSIMYVCAYVYMYVLCIVLHVDSRQLVVGGGDP